jgi:hypothetical protein
MPFLVRVWAVCKLATEIGVRDNPDWISPDAQEFGRPTMPREIHRVAGADR